jgi:ABC-type transport system involved in Fe-S cluster assembly fused permease/ATPase subunit
MAFWAHYDGFFAKVSFTTMHLFLVVMVMLSLSLMTFKCDLNLVDSTTIEFEMI